MKRLLIVILTAFTIISSAAQVPSVAGPWYGTINPPGVEFEIAVTIQKRDAGGWTGVLLMENGLSFPLNDITIDGSAISFSLEVRPAAKASLKGALSPDGNGGKMIGTIPFGASS